MIVNPEYGFDKDPVKGMWDMQTAILNYHEEIETGKKVHPYCASWYTWPLILRPLAYYYVVKPVINNGVKQDIIYDVHAMGNPILWLFAFGAVLVLIYWLIRGMVNKLYPDISLSVASLSLTIPTIWLIALWEKNPDVNTTNYALWIPLIIFGLIIVITIGELYWQSLSTSFNLIFTTIPIYIVLNYLANLLPWIKVTRCIYIYHYMGSILFAILGLAWLVDQSIHSEEKWLRGTGITIVFLTIASFIWWLPIYLGLPLDRYQLAMRINNFLIWEWI
jgi:dolichyl-phosphate-mannose--protein O-mannosyl transferase